MRVIPKKEKSFELEFERNGNEKTTHLMLYQKALQKLPISVALYLRSLRIIAADEKNIPGPSRKLMDCK